MCVLTATEQHTWYPHVAGAAFAISPQGPGVGHVLKNREEAWQDIAHTSSCPFFLWSHSLPCDMNTSVVALLLIFVCAMPVALPSHLLACLTCQHTGPVQMSLCETQPPCYADSARDRARIWQVESSCCQHVTCLAALLCWRHASFCSLWGNGSLVMHGQTIWLLPETHV